MKNCGTCYWYETAVAVANKGSCKFPVNTATLPIWYGPDYEPLFWHHENQNCPAWKDKAE